jgi:thiopurine S-methyltransferase
LSIELNKDYWNQLYLDKESPWDIGYISTPLKEYFDQLTNKDLRILIPGAGNSYEAEYLHNLGFKNVYVCDYAKEPLQNLQKRCPGFDPSHLLQQDFFKLKDRGFDLIVEQTFFCAIHPSLRRNYFLKMKELLKPGGHLVGVLFDDKLNDRNPPFGGNKEEYRDYFKDIFAVKVFESCYNSIKPRAGRELFINLVNS